MKFKTVFVCQKCGYETPKWAGKCPDCGEWNTLAEEVKAQESKKALLPYLWVWALSYNTFTISDCTYKKNGYYSF